VTLDKDFGELAVVRNIPHSGVIRLVGISAHKQAEICLFGLERYKDVIEKGAIITVEADRVRIRPALSFKSSLDTS
jgi:predicted nuclease of predicted toxin-antitoxin system